MTVTLPSTQAISSLLDQLDTMTHDARQREIAKAAYALHIHHERARLDALISQLLDGDITHQRLAMTAAAHGHQAEVLYHGARAESLHIRRYALDQLCTQPDALPWLSRLLDVDIAHIKEDMLRHIRTRDRGDVAPALIQMLVERDELHQAASLLPLCKEFELFAAPLQTTAESVYAHLDVCIDLMESLDPEALPLGQLAIGHPALTLAYLEDQGALLFTSSFSRHYADLLVALRQLATHVPARVASLVEEIIPEYRADPDFRLLLRQLARHVPDAAHRILTHPERSRSLTPHLPWILHKRLRHWSPELRQTMFDVCTSSQTIYARLLEELPPTRRATHFERSWPEEERATLIWEDAMMRALPHDLRQREARRILALSITAQQKELELRMWGYLPLKDSLAFLREATRHREADARAMGWRTLIRAHDIARAPLTDLLASSSRLHNDQDPVRHAALRALADLPPSRFAPEDATHLLTLARHATEARDISWQTRYALLDLFKNLMREHSGSPDSPLLRCAFDGLLLLAKQGHILDLPGLEDSLNPQSAVALTRVMLPWLEETQARDYNANVLAFIGALGRLARPIEPLQDLLAHLIQHDQTLRHHAARLWLDDPHTQLERALELLDRDKSAFLLPAVANLLHRYRQDLLTPFLDGTPLRGKFTSTPKIYRLPHFDSHFYRWTTSQQRLFLDTLERVVRDDGQAHSARASLIYVMASMPATQIDDLGEFIAHEEVPIQEAALGASVWLDRPQHALPVLLEHTSSDRARVAMYAIPRLARQISTAVFLDALDALLERPWLKVTVAKEVMRLLGTMHTEGAARRLLAQWRKHEVHRDVRIAMLHAAYALIDFEDARVILEEASRRHEDHDMLLAWLHMDIAPVPHDWRAQLVRWQLSLLEHPDARIRRALYARRQHVWLFEMNPELRELLYPRAVQEVLSLDRTAPWFDAAKVLVGHRKLEEVQLILSALISELITRRHQDVDDDTRDLPYRRRLEDVIEHLSLCHYDRTDTSYIDYIEHIIWPADCWYLRAQLAWRSMRDDPDNTACSDRLARVLQEAPSALDAYMSAHTQFGERHAIWYPEERAHKIVTALGAQAGIKVELALVACIEALGTQYRWTLTWRSLLETCRQSEHDSVRHYALRVSTSKAKG